MPSATEVVSSRNAQCRRGRNRQQQPRRVVALPQADPVQFHILMAHSVLNQLRVNQYLKPDVESHVKWLALTHQTEAMAILRKKISEPNTGHEILLGALSLATFEHHYGDPDRSLIHIKAFRELHAQLSVETLARPRLSEQQAQWFEGIDADPEASLMWNNDTSQQRLGTGSATY